MSVRVPPRRSSCLGRWLLLSGHRRVPSPPARMATWVSAGTLYPLPLAGTVTEERESLVQSLVQRHGCLPSKRVTRKARIEHDTHDVTLASGSEVRLKAVAGHFGQRIEDLAHGRFSAGADVEGHARAALERGNVSRDA